MGLLYTASFAATAVTAQVDFFEYTAPADAIAIIHWIQISQSTDVGDAAEEGLHILLKSGATTTGTGGSQAVTIVPKEFGFPAAGGVTATLNTTKATGGTIVTHYSGVWNVRTPWDWLPTPELRIVLSPSRRFTVELATTPADSLTCAGIMEIEEIGG